jgi:serine/threonine protein kinase
MGKIYGSRWEVVGDLGKGGQGEVFEARDRANPNAEHVALKRVRNPNRHARFRSEVESIKRLDHPNVIKIIDHSALENELDVVDRQFLVMPIARGGDLSRRVKGFGQNLDGTLLVVRQIASALSVAHAAGIVHRDIKPQNILFCGESSDVWLSDFGICFVKDRERITIDDEVVGPWAFMAPELEDGGALDVSEAADIYSLGKVMYYMISGGIILPRERLADPAYAGVFSRGGRYTLLQILLRKMVCQIHERIPSMESVSAELKNIEDWDRQSVVVPLSPASRSKIELLQMQAVEGRQAAAENLASRQAQEAADREVRSSIQLWLRGELEKTAALLGKGEVLSSEVGDIAREELVGGTLNNYRASCGTELLVRNVSIHYDVVHTLQIFICRASRVVFLAAGQMLPPEDAELGILPIYRRKPSAPTPQKGAPDGGYYFSQTGALVAMAAGHGANTAPGLAQRGRSQAVAPTQVLFTQLRVSQWPAMEAHIRTLLTMACDNFIDVIARTKDSPFPR